MKKLAYIFLLAGSLVMGINSVNAADDGAKSKAKTRFVSYNEQTSQIKVLIGTPGFEVGETTSIEVNFNMSEDNVLSVNSINTDNIKIEKYVFKQINGKKIKGNNIELKNQTIRVDFVPDKQVVFNIL